MISLIRRNRQLWTDGSESVVAEALLRAQAAQSQTDRDNWRKLHDFLRGCHYEHTSDAASAIYPERARAWNTAGGLGYRYLPAVKMYVDKLSVAMAQRIPELELYDGRTGEPLPADDPQVGQWRDDLVAAEAKTTLPTLERWTTAMGQAVISPTWKGDRVAWDLSPVYQVRAWQSLHDPSSFASCNAISFEVAQPVDTVGRALPSIWSTWTREQLSDGSTSWGHYVHQTAGALEDNPLFADNVNGYGMFPHVLVRTGRPAPGELWIPPNEAWIAQQIGLNLAVTDMWHGARYQIHPVAVFTGTQGEYDEAPVTGPGVGLQMPPGSSLSFVSPSLNLDEYRTLIDHDLTIGGLAESIDPTTFTSQGAYQSIASLQLRRHDLQIRREAVIPYYTTAIERDLWNAHRTVANYWQTRGARRRRYEDWTRLRCIWRPLPQVVDRQADALATELEIDRGITSVVERVADREGVDFAEAARRVQTRLAMRDQVEPATDGG